MSDKQPETLQFRPHHFLCTYCFQGKGYSPQFIENYQAIAKRLNARDGDEQRIKIVWHTDTICAPCPHRREKLCETEEKIQHLDAYHAKALGLKNEDAITWGEAKKRIRENINLKTFNQICNSCQWKPLGLCENVINQGS